MKILVFLHGTVLMHKDNDSVLDYANYVPVGNAVLKLKKCTRVKERSTTCFLSTAWSALLQLVE